MGGGARGALKRERVETTFFLLDEPAPPGAVVTLAAEESHHALRVLRLATGAVVPATDGRGGRYRLRLVARGRFCDAEVLDRVDEAPPVPSLAFGVGAGRRERFLWCAEKLTELGASALTPLLGSTVQDRRALAGEAGRRLAERALARAAAALKQSKGTHLPRIESPREVADWAREPFAGRSILLAFPGPNVVPLAMAVRGGAGGEAARGGTGRGGEGGAFRIAVGPEGGFLPEEERALADAGFTAAHLGDRRLRFETAAVVAAAQVHAVLALTE